MESELGLTPLQPREFFGTPWSGEGGWTPRPWLCWLPGPRRFRFRSFTSWLTDELWLVHDTTIWEDGREERRDGLARLVAADRIRFTYDDMPGGPRSSSTPTASPSRPSAPRSERGGVGLGWLAERPGLGGLERLHGPGVVDVHERVELARALAANQ
jgi:hypothetical protein